MTLNMNCSELLYIVATRNDLRSSEQGVNHLWMCSMMLLLCGVLHSCTRCLSLHHNLLTGACARLAHSLEKQAQNHHVVNTTLAVGIVSQHGHEGKQQAHKAILQDERADGDLPVCHVTGTAVL